MELMCHCLQLNFWSFSESSDSEYPEAQGYDTEYSSAEAIHLNLCLRSSTKTQKGMRSDYSGFHPFKRIKNNRLLKNPFASLRNDYFT